MCVIYFAYNCHPRYHLVLAANRDEYYQRPTAAAAFWPDHPDILAGRDLKEGGTWMGISTQGYFAALTNYRDPSNIKAEARSRGHLVRDYLSSKQAAESYIANLPDRDHAYNGFNLLMGSREAFYYYSNREKMLRRVPAGIHGLSNALLNTPWPKVNKGTRVLTKILQQETIAAEQLFSLLSDRQMPDDHDLPDTGVSLEMERMLAPIFVSSPDYGTCLSTVLLVEHNNSFQFWERSYINGQPDKWTEVYHRCPDKSTA